MAERRMFAKTIIDSDFFLDMPMSARLLYYDLGMRADDDGFVNSPKKIMKMCGNADNDLSILIAKKFIILFQTGIIVIKHWKLNNYLRADRYRETSYLNEKSQLEIKENGSYKTIDSAVITCLPDGIPVVDAGKVSIGKLSKGKNSKEESPKQKKEFAPPTIEEVNSYIIEKKLTNVTGERFLNYFTESGWVDSNGKEVKNWRLKLQTWDGYKEKNKKKQEVLLPERRLTPEEQIVAAKAKYFIK